MAALSELRNQIRSGDVFVVGSRQHKDFDEYLVSKEEWDTRRFQGTRLAVSMNVEEYLEERTESLLARLKWFQKTSMK